MNKFWNFIKNSDADAELFFYGPISDTSWWGDEITPAQFAKDLKALGDVSKITVRINSPGGDVFAAVTIASLLRDHKAEVISQIDGLAASAATIIAAKSDKVRMSKNSMMMIHQASSLAYGNADDMEKTAEVLRKVDAELVDIYKKKTSKDEKELHDLMKATTWMTAEEALNNGFADEIIEEKQVKVAASIDAATWERYQADLRELLKVQPPADPIDNQDDREKSRRRADNRRSFFNSTILGGR